MGGLRWGVRGVRLGVSYIMFYGIIGTGAIGGYYGAKLARAGKDVHFLLHSDYEQVAANGLQVDSVAGSFTLPAVNAYRRAADMPPCDVVLVGLKTVNQHLLPTLLPPLLKPDTLVVLIQNGVGVEAAVQQMFPHVQLAAGLAFICVAKNRPGVVEHLDKGSIDIGNYSCRDAARMAHLMADLADAGIEAREVEYHEARWRKAVWNMPFNGLSVALRATTDALLADEASHGLVRALMLEVIGAARALGVEALTPELADRMIAYTLAMKPYSPSMKLDFDYHRPMEIEFLYTRPIALARQAGFDMPRLSMLEAQLRFEEGRTLKTP